MKVCERFARALAKVKGLSYTQARKKYPRGYDKNSVYINATETIEAHCVHCARAEALSKESE